MSKIVRIGILAANGIEDMEFIIPFDIWRRAKFVVETISCEVKNNATLHYSNMKITTNFKLKLTNLEQYDVLFFPGGPAFRAYLSPPATAKDLSESKLHTTIKKFYKNPDKWLVSICAAPISMLSILERELHPDTKFTCYNDPKLIGDYSKLWIDKPIVIDHERKFITAQAASCATQLAFLVVELFCGREEATKLAKTILYDYVSPLDSSN
ncbi:Glutamine amidotransferase-domain protein [Mycoplasma suis KI3806]|uniref:Glutamine amidotransferase-domain protein n=1 Tax=Mycoplasma suis (strain KI_3806) TaxID=708248 RepID=F0V3G6_MYCS3|nr:DJ-1/PfpI family protein [Mycoplasma suis]CBZ40388.1 Glutamine amidotransferase-domain protein [Mycoplasma suis KI3806]